MKNSFWMVWMVCGSLLYAAMYSDNDVDGVEDSIDLCPNTSFDILVDEDGCEEGKGYRGNWSIQAGTMTAIDKNSSNLNNALFSLLYTYKAWDMTLSTFRDINQQNDEASQTLYMTTGYTKSLSESIQINTGIGMKYSTSQNDYYATFNLVKNIQKHQSLSFFYSYTVAQDTQSEPYKNFHTLSLGYSKQMSQRWLTSLSYNFSTPSTNDLASYHAISWDNTWQFSQRYYLVGSYALGLSAGASDHVFSVQVGIDFD